jgi:hypothetical protein
MGFDTGSGKKPVSDPEHWIYEIYEYFFLQMAQKCPGSTKFVINWLPGSGFIRHDNESRSVRNSNGSEIQVTDDSVGSFPCSWTPLPTFLKILPFYSEKLACT